MLFADLYGTKGKTKSLTIGIQANANGLGTNHNDLFGAFNTSGWGKIYDYSMLVAGEISSSTL